MNPDLAEALAKRLSELRSFRDAFSRYAESKKELLRIQNVSFRRHDSIISQFSKILVETQPREEVLIGWKDPDATEDIIEVLLTDLSS